MKRRVLVVDDDELILQILTTILDMEDFEVRTVETGEDALAAVEEELPDVVVLDVMMPGMDGLEVCTRLRAEPETKDVPVILLTARGDPEDRQRGLDAGADAYLTKPFSPLELIRIIGTLEGGNGERRAEVGT